MSDATQLLPAIEAGDPHAAQQLLPLVYDELRKLAAQKMACEVPGQTLQATALVHEAYLRLVESRELGSPPRRWDSRGHFFAAAAEAMRRILIERARHRKSRKAGGGRRQVGLVEFPARLDTPREDLLALDEALQKLAGIDRRKSDLVKLRYFAGLTIPQAAEMLGISPSTADNDWAYARCWLRLEMSSGADGPAS